MVGDTPHDAEACRQANVPCIGVRCGGHDDGTLRGAGCVAVYADPRDLLNHLDEALRVAAAD
jgi:phosphoglycolate phosphatase